MLRAHIPQPNPHERCIKVNHSPTGSCFIEGDRVSMVAFVSPNLDRYVAHSRCGHTYMQLAGSNCTGGYY